MLPSDDGTVHQVFLVITSILFFTFQYLMTKTAAMHLQGRGGDLGSHHQAGLGGMGGGNGGGTGTNGSLNGGLSGGSGSGRGGAGEVKPHQCQQY